MREIERQKELIKTLKIWLMKNIKIESLRWKKYSQSQKSISLIRKIESEPHFITMFWW